MGTGEKGGGRNKGFEIKFFLIVDLSQPHFMRKFKSRDLIDSE